MNLILYVLPLIFIFLFIIINYVRIFHVQFEFIAIAILPILIFTYFKNFNLNVFLNNDIMKILVYISVGTNFSTIAKALILS